MDLKKLFSFACCNKTKENADEQKAEECCNNYVKQHVRKHSKLYFALEDVLKNKYISSSQIGDRLKYRIDDALGCWEEDGKIKPDILEEFMEEVCGITLDSAKSFLDYIVNLKNGNLDDTDTLTDEYINLLSTYRIPNKDNYLYGIYKVRDIVELKQIILKAPMNANLNWVDVSGLTDLPNIYDEKPGFNGNISLWNV